MRGAFWGLRASSIELKSDGKQQEALVMPTYEFLCQKCAKPFERICSLEEYDRQAKKRTKCPKCGSTSVVRQISAVQVKTSKKS
jgi:putative FmdB family regulatory protein